MKRRELLGGLFALSAAGVLGGCRDSEKSDHDDSHRELKTLKVVLQGPFAVVLRRDEKHEVRKVTAFVPMDSLHEFRFQTPGPDSVQKSSLQYRFKLGSEGLEISERRPYIDHGLDDLNFDLGKWEPTEKDYFVSIDLPGPDLITFIPPGEPVVFVGGRLAFAPLNHVLEYRIRDLSKVLLHSEQLKDQPPLAFSEIFKHYDEHGKQEQEYKGKPGHGPQFPLTKDELGRPSEADVYTYFLGVGVPPNSLTDADAVQHGLDFFNNKLVSSFPNSPNLKKLSEIREYGDPCTPMGKTAPARVKPTILKSSTHGPRLLLISSAEDCRSPGLLGGCNC